MNHDLGSLGSQLPESVKDFIGLLADHMEEVDKKMAVNRARQWELDGSGCGYHK